MKNYQKLEYSKADDSTVGSQLQQYSSQRQSSSSYKDGHFYYQNKIYSLTRKMTQTKQSTISLNNQIRNSLLSEEKHQTMIETTQLHENNQRSQSSKISLNSAMFAMMAGALGTGIFNLPLRITQIGVIMFAVYVLLACAFSYIGCLLLQKMIIKKGFTSYGQICSKSYGKGMLRLSQACLILFPWGIAICFQVIMAKFILQLLADVFGADLYSDRNQDILNSNGETTRVILNVGIICAEFGLIQLKDMRIIQRLAVIGVCSVIYNAVTIFVLLFTGFTHEGNPDVHYESILKLDWSIVEWALFKKGWFSMHTQAVASILFCYINHQLVFPTCKNMENPTDSRLKACFLRSNVNELVVYVIIGLAGYLLLIQHQDEFPISPMVLTSISTWPMTLGKALMIITLFLAVPLSIFPARTILKEALNVQDNNQIHYILSIGLALSSSIIAITFVKVNSYFGLLGGTAGVLMGGGIPALCFWKTIVKDNKQERTLKNYAILILCGMISVIGFIGAILSVFDPV